MKNISEITTLAIDTSCDETSVAVVKGLEILSNIQPSQMEYHKKYGGVVPNLAKLAHQEKIDSVVLESFKTAFPKNKITKESDLTKLFEKIDYIGVTVGPGLAIALEVGIKKAKELASKYKKPLIPINHMEGHLLSGFAQRKKYKNFEVLKNEDFINYPSIGVLVSGGHTEIILINGIGDYKLIGETLDDSLGECFDKCGRLMGLGYPAGPVISKFAHEHRKNFLCKVENRNRGSVMTGFNLKTNSKYDLPIPMSKTDNLEMSYSGLKTAFNQLVSSLSEAKITSSKKLDIEEQISLGLSKDQIFDLCVLLEATAYEQLLIKVKSALVQYNPKEIWLGGGVVASRRLKQIFRDISKKRNFKLRIPFSRKLTTDNAGMIGVASNMRVSSNNIAVFKENFEKIDRIPNLSLS